MITPDPLTPVRWLRAKKAEWGYYILFLVLSSLRLCLHVLMSLVRVGHRLMRSCWRRLGGYCMRKVHVALCERYGNVSPAKDAEIAMLRREIDMLRAESALVGVGEPTDAIGDNELMDKIVDEAANMSIDALSHVETVLCAVNDQCDHRYDEQLSRLRARRHDMSNPKIFIEKVNDIHDNPNVVIGDIMGRHSR